MDQIEEYVTRIMKVLVFIEGNFSKELTLEELARIACYSPFHFSRIFQTVVGETVQKYMRRLRIELAARRLVKTRQSVTQIAIDANYDSPSAFTRAFKQFMGASPKRYRAIYHSMNTMTQRIKEFSMVRPEIIESSFSDLNILFIRRYGNYNESPWEAWEAIRDFIIENEIDSSKLRYFGIPHDDPKITNEGKLRYDAGVLVPEGIQGKGEVGKQTLKGRKYAIFTHEGSFNTIEDTYKRVLFKWLPKSGECIDDTRPVFCEYLNMNYIKTNPEKVVTKLYIPLI